MIFLMMAAHDTSTSTATTMSYYLAANPEWQDRCRDESDRLGDGPVDIESLEKLESLDLVMNESIRLVRRCSGQCGSTVRDTELLGYYLPKGTNVIAYPGLNHRLAEFWTDPIQVRPRPVRRTTQRAQEAPLRVHAVRRRLAQVHRHGVRPARDQDDHAPAAAQVPARACPAPVTRPTLRLRRHAGADGRPAHRAAAAALRLSDKRSRLANGSVLALAAMRVGIGALAWARPDLAAKLFGMPAPDRPVAVPVAAVRRARRRGRLGHVGLVRRPAAHLGHVRPGVRRRRRCGRRDSAVRMATCPPARRARWSPCPLRPSASERGRARQSVADGRFAIKTRPMITVDA